MPDNWHNEALEAAKEMREAFKDEGFGVVVNADQTFIKFYSESDYGIAPKSTKRVGGSVNADTQIGFILMVAAELNTSTLKDPFVAFTGTKMEDAASAVSRLQTNDCKHSTWREDEHGTTYDNFQKKHWFDAAITLRHLKALLHEMHPGLKAGLTWDHAT